MQNSWHSLPSEEVLRLLEVDPKTGLTLPEVERRQATFGLNRITARKGTPAWVKFLQQFNAPLVYILLAAVVVTGVLGEWVDSAVIFTVVFINAIVGYLQESKAEKAINSLSKMIPSEATVLRDGAKQRVHSESLVPGDVVRLQAGDQMPADVRLIYAKNLQVDESALTGESAPVMKDCAALPAETGLADRRNLAFSGALVTAGQAEAIVCATGDQTETGNIARLISESVDISTPLTKKIARLSALLVWVILILAAATFGIGVVRGESPVEMFMAAVALAVGAIPEGLPAAVTIVLAIGVSRMAKRRAVIRKLPAVETLGGTTIICSDKTGTLTENQVTVRKIFAGSAYYEVSGSGYAPKGDITFNAAPVNLEQHGALAECLRAGVLCNDSQLNFEEGRWKVQGDPTEAALLVVGEKSGLLRHDTHLAAPRLDVVPFESEHMFRATLHEHGNARLIYKVGAVERLLDRCVDAPRQPGASRAAGQNGNP